MTLEELHEEVAGKAVVYPRVDDADMTLPVLNPIQVADAILRGRSASYTETQQGLMIVREEEDLPVSVVIVENEDGVVQYMRRDPNGHLGAIDA